MNGSERRPGLVLRDGREIALLGRTVVIPSIKIGHFSSHRQRVGAGWRSKWRAVEGAVQLYADICFKFVVFSATEI